MDPGHDWKTVSPRSLPEWDVFRPIVHIAVTALCKNLVHRFMYYINSRISFHFAEIIAFGPIVFSTHIKA